MTMRENQSIHRKKKSKGHFIHCKSKIDWPGTEPKASTMTGQKLTNSAMARTWQNSYKHGFYAVLNRVTNNDIAFVLWPSNTTSEMQHNGMEGIKKKQRYTAKLYANGLTWDLQELARLCQFTQQLRHWTKCSFTTKFHSHFENCY